VLAGAAKTDLQPRPDDMRAAGFPGARWEQDPARCKVIAPVCLQRLLGGTEEEIDHLTSTGSPWPENPNCL
jgi:hypothetical protein